MDFYTAIYFSYSILIAGMIALVRFPRINRNYHPFVFLLWTGCLNEMVSHYLVSHGQYNIINSNIYSLAESLLLLWFLRRSGQFDRRRLLFIGLLSLFLLAWVAEAFVLHPFGTAFVSYFNVIYSFPIVMLCINLINRLITTERELLRNPSFLICIGLIIFFTYRIIVEMFWLYGLSSNYAFSNQIFNILVWINLFCNLIYALAVLWMRKKQAFSLRY